MQRINSDSEIESVIANLGIGNEEKLRESERRQENLEKFAQLRSRNPQTTLNLDETHTAFVEADDEDGFVDITVSSKPFEQKISELPQKYHDYLVQKALTGHEVGHILYSSYPALEKFSDKVREDELDTPGNDKNDADTIESMFQDFYNALEDGAIEKFLSENYLLDEELLHLRATIHEDEYWGKEIPLKDETEYQYPFYMALMTAAINLGVYDNGELWKLLDENNEQHFFAKRGGEIDRKMFVDECLPLLKKEIPNIQSETDAYNRTEKIYELWSELKKYIDRSTTQGKKEHQMMKEQQDNNSYEKGVPQNISEDHGEQSKEPISGSGSGNEEVSGGEEESGTYGEKRRDRAETSYENGQGGDIEEKGEEGVMQEAKQEGNDWSDEIEEVINALGAGDGIDEIGIAEDNTVKSERFRKAKNLSKRTSRLFERRLRQLKKDKTIRNKRRGDFDTSALVEAERGSTRCFKQTRSGDEKNYRCMVVVDRSGSMSSHIEDVELAVGAITWGLEENGVDTCIIDTENSMTTLSKPFGSNTDSFKEKVFGGRCSGGTPLRYTMDFARKRMSRGDGDVPFCIVITDGRPRNESKFKDQVRKANFPVLGMYLTNNRENVKDQLSLYDKSVVVNNEDDVNQKLINLINKIIF